MVPWTNNLKRFYIISRDQQEKNLAFINEILDYIKRKGGSGSYGMNPEDEDTNSRPLSIPKDTECILTVGGDGTLIRAAQNTFGSQIPLLGINRGHLGYLCDLDEDTVFSAIDRLFEDDYEMEERMMISGHVEHLKGMSNEVSALNDIVICSTGGLQVINLTIYVNRQYLYSYNCDGMIFSTPTGSTAYNLSANGPIVDPKTNLILLTPINPHTLNSRSIVLDQEDEIAVEVGRRRSDVQETAEISFDGNHKQILQPGERLIVHKAQQKTQMIRLSEMNFLERIRSKMQAD